MNYWPFYLPREFSNVIVAAVYIAPSCNTKFKAKANANADEACRALYNAINELLATRPDSLVVVAEDFNHTTLYSPDLDSMWFLTTVPPPP